MLKLKYHSIVQFCSVAFLGIFFILPTISHAANRTSSGAGDWNATTTWGSASVPGSGDDATVNHALNLNSNLTIGFGATYTFNASTTGGAPAVTIGTSILNAGGELDIKSPATVTLGSVNMYLGIIHVYNGATLNITGDLNMDQSTIIVDAGGTLNVGGNFTNTNGVITDNGTIAIGGNYTSNSTLLQGSKVTGTGVFTTVGSMKNNTGFLSGGSSIFNDGGDCNTGPCSGRCLAGMTTGAITTSTTSFCSGSAVTGVTFSTPAVTGATFSWTFPAGFTIATGANTRSVTVNISATASSGNVTVQATNSTCTGNVSTLAVTVGKPAGTAVVSGSSPVCQGTSQVYTLSGVTNATSYAWTVTGATIASGAGTTAISVNMGTTASVPISVIPSNACGNATGVTLGSKTVTVNLTNAATIAYSSASYCSNITASQAVTRTGTAGGTYSYTASPSGTLGSFSTTTGSFIPSSSTPAQYTITYSMAATGCSAATATAVVTIGAPVGTAVVTGTSPVCQGTSQVYSVSGVVGATNYTWSVPSDAVITAGAGTSSITVTMGTTSGPVSVTPSNTCGNGTGSAIGSKAVTVNLTNAATITYPSSSYFCTGTTGAQIPIITGMTGGTFTKTAGTLSSFAGSTGSFVPNGSTPGTYTITYNMAATACPAGTATASISVSSIIPSGTAAITGSASVCQNTSYAYSVTGITGAAGYTWSVPSGASVTAGAGTNSITVLMGSASGTVSVIPFNGCGNATGVSLGSKAVTVSLTNAATIAYPGSPYCSNNSTSQVPTVTGTSGGTFSISGGTVRPTFAASTGAFTPNAPAGATKNTPFTVTYTMAATGCPAATATTTVTISSASLNTPGSFTGATSVCQNTAGGVYSVGAVTNATNYTWVLPAGATITSGSGTRTITVTMGDVSGNFTVTPSSASCTGTTSSPYGVAVTPCANTWKGTSSTAWNTAGNWSLGTIPTEQNDVIIPATVATNRWPEIASGVTAKAADVTLSGGSASLTINSAGALNAYGSITNNGTFTANSGSTVVLMGTSTQILTGVSTLYNTTVNNNAGATIASGSANALTTKGNILLTKGTLTTNDNLTVDIDNGGNIGYVSGDAGSVSGNVTVFRAVNSITTHYISCPLDGVTMRDLADDAEVINPATNKTRLFQYNAGTFTWSSVDDSNSVMSPSSAFSMWFPAATSVGFTGTYNHAASYSSSSPNVATKFMFVSNPYPSTLDWDAASGWTKTGIKNAVYFWNPTTNSYSSYVNSLSTNGGTQFIPAMNSFFVAYDGNAGTPTATVGIANGVRSSTYKGLWRTAADETVRITLKSSSGAADETVIRFNDQATNEFDNDLDAYKFLNAATVPSIYTMSGSTKYSINSIASPDAKDTVPVFTKIPADGAYVLSIKNSDPTVEYILVDKKLGTETAVGTQDYPFTALKTDSINRFDLQMRQVEVVATGIQQASVASVVQILSSPNGFLVKSGVSGIGSIEILDATGNRVNVLKDASLISGNNFFTPALSDGMYLVKVTIGNNSYMGQVAILK